MILQYWEQNFSYEVRCTFESIYLTKNLPAGKWIEFAQREKLLWPHIHFITNCFHLMILNILSNLFTTACLCLFLCCYLFMCLSVSVCLSVCVYICDSVFILTLNLSTNIPIICQLHSGPRIDRVDEGIIWVISNIYFMSHQRPRQDLTSAEKGNFCSACIWDREWFMPDFSFVKLIIELAIMFQLYVQWFRHFLWMD